MNPIIFIILTFLTIVMVVREVIKAHWISLMLGSGRNVNLHFGYWAHLTATCASVTALVSYIVLN